MKKLLLVLLMAVVSAFGAFDNLTRHVNKKKEDAQRALREHREAIKNHTRREVDELLKAALDDLMSDDVIGAEHDLREAERLERLD